jgi:hypothetical protein
MLTAIYAAGCGYDHASTGATGLVGVARQLKAALQNVSTNRPDRPAEPPARAQLRPLWLADD